MKKSQPIQWKRNDVMIKGKAEREICLQPSPQAGKPLLFLTAYCGSKKQEQAFARMANKIVLLLNEEEEFEAMVRGLKTK